MKKLTTKSCPVIIIHPSQSGRVELRGALNESGFQDIHTGDSVADVRKFQRTAPDGWAIMPMFAAARESGMELLRETAKDKSLQEFRVTFVVDDVEFTLLPEAFEHGLLSWIKGPVNRKLLSEGIESLMLLGEKFRTSSVKVAAEYLRRYLDQVADYDNVFRLEANMQKLFPRDGRPLFGMAKALLTKGHGEDAKQAFRQAVYLDPDLQAEIHQYLQEVGGRDAEQIQSVIGFRTCLIVDPDQDILKALTEILANQFKVSEIKSFTDGEKAWQCIQDGFAPVMIFQEWKIGGLGGAEFLQRVRHHGLTESRIMIVSSLLDARDYPLLREMDVYDVIPKPFQREETIAVIERVLHEENFPASANGLVKKIHEAIDMSDFVKARHLKKQLATVPQVPKGQEKFVEAEILFAEKKYDQAKSAVFDAIRTMGRESADGLNLLGKILLALNELESALKVLERAQELSPRNINRLCDIATIHTEVGDVDRAQETVEKASAMDRNALVVRETEVKISMAVGDKSGSKKKMKDLENVKSIVSQMNNRAVAYVRTNAIDKALKLYRQTLDALPSDEREMRSKVLYNMGLACVRNDNLEKAKVHLLDAGRLGNETMKGKIGSLNKKVTQSIKSGKKIKLNEDAEITSRHASVEDIFEQLRQAPSGGSRSDGTKEPKDEGRCLYQVFFKAS